MGKISLHSGNSTFAPSGWFMHAWSHSFSLCLQVISESGGGDENVEGGPMENLPMTPTDEPSSDSSVSFPLSSPSQILSPSSPSVTPSEPPSLQEQVNVFAWRSPRQRITTQRFTSENFRESSKEKGKSKSPRGARGKQFGSSGWPTGVVECCEEEWEKKQGELDTLRNLQLDSLRCVLITMTTAQ